MRTVDGVTGAFVTNVPGEHGDRVGAVVVCDTDTLSIESLRDEARTLLSAFKVPTVWLLSTTGDDLPRGATGKVDVRRLRELLTNSAEKENT